MDIGNMFKIDVWWKFVLIVGVLLAAAAFMLNIEFIERRYVLGLGIGLVLIGIGYWMAKKVANEFTDTGIFSYPIYKHNFVTVLLIALGIIDSVFFFVKILLILAK